MVVIAYSFTKIRPIILFGLPWCLYAGVIILFLQLRLHFCLSLSLSSPYKKEKRHFPSPSCKSQLLLKLLALWTRGGSLFSLILPIIYVLLPLCFSCAIGNFVPLLYQLSFLYWKGKGKRNLTPTMFLAVFYFMSAV